MRIFIDLQNMLHALACYQNLLRQNYENALARLMLDVGEYQVRTGDKIALVFDGQPRSDHPLMGHGLELLFSGPQKTADALIETLVHQSKDRGEIWVVTNDHALQNLIFAQGASFLSPESFKKMMDARKND